MTKPKSEPTEPVSIHFRETFEAQLPLIAAILAISEEDFDPKQLARDAIELVMAIEEELG